LLIRELNPEFVRGCIEQSFQPTELAKHVECAREILERDRSVAPFQPLQRCLRDTRTVARAFDSQVWRELRDGSNAG
jgi:hypothetical protein